MTIAVPLTKYICIDYPGIVNDHKKAIETLGNECQLHEIFNDKRKRLELKFRRNDEHSRGVYGDHSNCNAIVLRVKRKKSGPVNSPVHVEILAYVDTVYSFTSLCDYQYQPIERIGAINKYRSIQPFLAVNGFHKSTWLFENVPVFISSPQYSRYDKQFDLRTFLKGQNDLTQVSSLSAKPKHHLKSYMRNYRSPCPQFSEETQAFIEEICKNPFTKTWYLKVKEIFDEKPIWTSNLLSAKINFHSPMLKKKVMSSVAYYFSDGPWGKSWVRYGYDPLLNPSAKIYQTIDCRILRSTGKARNFKDKSMLTINSSAIQEEMPEINYRFVPNEVPTFCHVCYMMYDTEHEEIQKLLHSNDGRETICTEKDGWLPAGTLDRCRNLLKKHFETLREKLYTNSNINNGNEDDEEKSDGTSSDDQNTNDSDE